MVTPKRRPGLIAFAASLLLAQLVLAAGHIHLGRSQGQGYAGASSSHAPDDPHEKGTLCPICWVQAAAETLFVPPPVETPLPAKLFAETRIPSVLRHAAPLAATGFDPRAPPAA